MSLDRKHQTPSPVLSVVCSLSSCYTMQRLTAENCCKLSYKRFLIFWVLLWSKKQTKVHEKMKFLLFWRKVVFYTALSNQDTLKRFEVPHGPKHEALEDFSGIVHVQVIESQWEEFSYLVRKLVGMNKIVRTRCFLLMSLNKTG